MAGLVVFTLLGVPRSVPQRCFQLGLWDLFHIRVPRDATLVKLLPIEPGECRDIRDEPGLHGLCHEVTTIVRKAASGPSIPFV